MPEDSIWIVTDDAVDLTVPDGAKGSWGDELRSSPTVLAKGVKLKATELQQKMSDFLQVIGCIFQEADRAFLRFSQTASPVRANQRYFRLLQALESLTQMPRRFLLA